MLKIGSHVSVKGKKMLLGSAEETIFNQANCLMIYTGAPQNTKRKPIDEFNLEAATELLEEHNINKEDIIVHAPYIINLANTIKEDTFALAVDFLKQEIQRVEEIGAKYIVLHPGSHVNAGEQVGLDQIVYGLNLVLTKEQSPIICLETMAGKGSELGYTFEQLAYIINNVKLSEKLGVCLDTCHINDAGYDLDDFDGILKNFDEVIGLDRLKVIHLNDSKNPRGSRKDRHENIGYGSIGFEKLCEIAYHPKLENMCKILETPYVENKELPPYYEEIKMLKEKKFNNWLDQEHLVNDENLIEKLKESAKLN